MINMPFWGLLVLVALLGLVWLLARRHAVVYKGNRRRGFSWRQSEYYKSFVAGLDAADRLKFLAHSEAEQYTMYIDWTLREGIRESERGISI